MGAWHDGYKLTNQPEGERGTPGGGGGSKYNEPSLVLKFFESQTRVGSRVFQMLPRSRNKKENNEICNPGEVHVHM